MSRKGMIYRLLDRLAYWLARKGKGFPFLHLLRVPGRRTGELHEIALAVVADGPHRWVVAQIATSSWVANVRSTPHATLSRGGHDEAVELTEVDDLTRAAEVIGKYRALTGKGTAKYFPSNDRGEATRHPVFAVTSLPPDRTRQTSTDIRAAEAGDGS